MRILVTGGGGFLGRHVVERLLARGYEVRAIGRSPQPDLQAKGVEFRCGDLTDEKALHSACSGMDAVFHIAAKAGIWGHWESFYLPNVIGSRNIVAACKANGIGRLVYTSTSSVVFNGRAISGLDETMPYGRHWLCHYAHTKAIAEKETLAANDENLKIIALRPHLVFGPGDPHLLPRILESAIAGRLTMIGKGKAVVDVSYVGNVADAHLDALDALVQRETAGKAYFISQGEPVELWSWINRVLEALGYAPICRKVPLSVAYSMGLFFEIIWTLLQRAGDPSMTRFVAVELAKNHFFNISAARNDLGYVPRVCMEEALKHTVDDLQSRGF